MNLIDFITLGVFAAVFLLCIYRGFTHSLLSLASILLSITFALIFMPIAANAIKSSDKIMPMMLYYTEGSEFIKDSELAKRDVTSFSSAELESIIKNVGLPYPISKCVSKNIVRESFAKQDIHTLGDYFNQTMVSVFVNIFAFFILFLAFRLIFMFVLNWYDYAAGLPVLKQYDALFACAVGVLRSMAALSVIYMAVPVFLTFFDQIEVVHELIAGSLFMPLFYESNIILGLIPAV